MLLKACDISLVVSATGVISDIAYNDETIFKDIAVDWAGTTFHDLVTVESQPKIDALLVDATKDNGSSWRQVNHMSNQFGDVPVSYSSFPLKNSDSILLVGRDLSGTAREQKRLMNAQLSMERAYARLQASEARYRQIFQSAGEAVLIIDCTTMKVIEANSLATRMFGATANKLVGRRLKDLLGSSDLNVSEALMQAALGGRIVKNLEVGGDENQHANVSATLLREDKKPILLLRLTPSLSDDAEISLPEYRISLSSLTHMPDGFVVTKTDGSILFANQSFSDVVEVLNGEKLRGDQLDRWFDRMGVDFNVLTTNLKEHGSVSRFSTTLRGEAGSSEQVEIAAVEISEKDETYYGFVIRSVGSADRPSPVEDGLLPYTAEQLTSLVGHMSLKDVVKETTVVIERLCIEAALELTGDNRASAAQLLGLSRQSLYDKLSKSGLA